MKKRKWIYAVLVVTVLVAGILFTSRFYLSTPETQTPTGVSNTKLPATADKTDSPSSGSNDPKQRSRLVSTYTSKAGDAPLPPPGTPLKQVYDELKARADAGDEDAASRLYDDLTRCLRVQQLRSRLPLLLTSEPENQQKQTADQFEYQQQILDSVQKQLDFLRTNKSLCADLSKAQLSSIVPVSLRAAQLGDEHALDCYVGLTSERMPDLLHHPEWLSDYRRNVPALLDTAIQNGDWRVVSLLQIAYAGIFQGTLLHELVDADAAMSYRYLQLQRLGATGAFADTLDQQIAQAQRDLSAEQIADATTWAAGTYSSYFNGSSSNVDHNGVNVCLDN